MKKMDKDKDGLITEQELMDWVEYIHNKYLWDDTDRHWKDWGTYVVDGKLSWSKYLKTSYGHETGRKITFTDRWMDALCSSVWLSIYMSVHLHYCLSV